jgi:hypothetical protein
VAFQAGAVHEPPVGGVVVGGTVGGFVGGVAPANRAVNRVKAQSACGTLLQVPDVVLWLGSGHWRSRLTDQNVYRARWWLVA